jgi:hypothetical protein
MRKISRSLSVGLIALPLAAAGAGVASAAPLPILGDLTSTSAATQTIDQSLGQTQGNTTTQSNDSTPTTTIGDATDGLIPVDVDALTAPLLGDTSVHGSTDQGNANSTDQGQTGGQAATGGDQG